MRIATTEGRIDKGYDDKNNTNDQGDSDSSLSDIKAVLSAVIRRSWHCCALYSVAHVGSILGGGENQELSPQEYCSSLGG